MAVGGFQKATSQARSARRDTMQPTPPLWPTPRKAIMQAVWNNTVIAESDKTVLVEGNHYFPEHTLKREYVTFSNHKTSCPWKGQASYYSLIVNGEMNTDSVWYYPDPKPEAENIRGHVAFFKGVKVG
jgi:uncharacterized protein (DUF427 family)